MKQAGQKVNEEHLSLVVKLADNDYEIQQALRLRYQVFVEEEKNQGMYNASGLETDEYDQYCDHLIVKNTVLDQVIGTYRLLPGERAVQHIGFYSETEFDLSRFQAHKPKTLELGRSCIAYEYRGTKVLQMLWDGIASYLADREYHYLIGCASLHVETLQELNEIYTLLMKKQVITKSYQIEPLQHCKIEGLSQLNGGFAEKEVFRKLPPLIKGYQWLGAKIAGEPAYDPQFKTTDFFIVLEKEKIAKKYQRHFLAAQ